jgi:phage terminase Nu1 subunit (DNA packaging protein)
MEAKENGAEKLAIGIYPEMAQLLSIGKAAAYDLAARPGFPVINCGGKNGRKIIVLDGLKRWLAEHAGEQIG